MKAIFFALILLASLGLSGQAQPAQQEPESILIVDDGHFIDLVNYLVGLADENWEKAFVAVGDTAIDEGTSLSCILTQPILYPVGAILVIQNFTSHNIRVINAAGNEVQVIQTEQEYKLSLVQSAKFIIQCNDVYNGTVVVKSRINQKKI